MGRPALNLAGLTFGRLKVIRRVFPNKYARQANWLCQCSCGRLHEAACTVLKRGGVTSCGCLAKEKKTTHGLARHPLYNTYIAMIDRCYDPTNPAYRHYGGRGIEVSGEWRGPDGLRRFLDDMGTRPAGMTLDREDNDGHYCKTNCRWATARQQAHNTRHVRLISHGDRQGSIRDWSKWTGLATETIRTRLAAGQSIESALEQVNRRRWARDKLQAIQITKGLSA